MGIKREDGFGGLEEVSQYNVWNSQGINKSVC